MNTPEKMFGELLRLGEEWTVERARFDEGQGVVE
jgi:hypothetical protein